MAAAQRRKLRRVQAATAAATVTAAGVAAGVVQLRATRKRRAVSAKTTRRSPEINNPVVWCIRDHTMFPTLDTLHALGVVALIVPYGHSAWVHIRRVQPCLWRS